MEHKDATTTSRCPPRGTRGHLTPCPAATGTHHHVGAHAASLTLHPHNKTRTPNSPTPPGAMDAPAGYTGQQVTLRWGPYF